MPDMPVSKLIQDIYDGKVVVPDFQREFVWKPEQVRSLLVSVLADYFIGSFLTLEQMTRSAYFELKCVAGVKAVNPKSRNRK